ncbi:hypothetical protein ABQE69_04300 [Mycolicibacillus trivialis]
MVEQHQRDRDRPDAVERRDGGAGGQRAATGNPAASKTRRLGIAASRRSLAGPLTDVLVIADTPLPPP